MRRGVLVPRWVHRGQTIAMTLHPSYSDFLRPTSVGWSWLPLYAPPARVAAALQQNPRTRGSSAGSKISPFEPISRGLISFIGVPSRLDH